MLVKLLAVVASLWCRHSRVWLCIRYFAIHVYELTVQEAFSFFFTSEIDCNRPVHFVKALLAKKVHFADCYAVFDARFSACLFINSNACAIVNRALTDPVHLHHVPLLSLNSRFSEVVVDPLCMNPCFSVVFVGTKAYSDLCQVTSPSCYSDPSNTLGRGVTLECL